MRKISIFRVYLVIALYSLAANFAHPITPTFIQNLKLHDYMFGVAFAAMSLTNFMFSPFWGKLSNNLGSNKIISFGFIGYGLAQGVFGLATTEAQIVVGRMLAGFFNGAIMVNQTIYIINNSPQGDRSRNLAISATIMSVVSPFGFLIGGLIGDYSIPMTFLLQVISLILVGVLNWFILEDPPVKAKEPLRKIIKESGPFQIVVNNREIFTLIMTSFFMIAVLTSFAFTAYEQSFNYFIKDQFGFPPSYSGILKAAIGFITLLTNATITMWLLKKADVARSLIAILTLCVLMMLSIILVGEVVPFIIINVIFFALNAIYLPLMQAMLVDLSDDDIDGGVLVGIFNSMRSFGMVGGSLFAGLIYAFGPRLAFVFSGIVFLLSVLAAFIHFKSQNKKVVESDLLA